MVAAMTTNTHPRHRRTPLHRAERRPLSPVTYQLLVAATAAALALVWAGILIGLGPIR